MSDIILMAAEFAKRAHAGQFRKYNGLPYITHPCRVAGRMLVEGNTGLSSRGWAVAAAMLHDTVEDCGVTYDVLTEQFGSIVSDTVYWLTNPSKHLDLPRAKRKEIDRQHIARAPHVARTIKLLDRIDNLGDLGSADDDFIRLYCDESELLLLSLEGTDTALELELARLIDRLRLERA